MHPAPAPRDAQWDAHVQSYLASYFAAHPDFAVYQGRHEFDGQLPDWSREGIGAEIDRLHGDRRATLAFDPASLDEGRRFEREALLAQVDRDLFWLETARSPFRNPYWYADALDPNVYEAREYAPLEQRLEAYIAYAREVPRAVAQIRANLETPLPRTYVDIGRTALGGLAAHYDAEVPLTFAPVESARLQSELREANAGAIRSVRELDAWLAGQVSATSDGYALGPDLFAEMLLRTERTNVPLDRLAEIGGADLERNLTALAEACAVYAPGEPVARCVARIQEDKPPGSPVEAARAQLGGLETFVRDRDLVGIPGDEQALVEEAPSYRRWNSAYIDIPGPYEKGVPAIYYIAEPDPAWPPEERRAYLPGACDLLFTSVHEVWPGHFLQFLHSNRCPSEISRVFVSYAFAEGWAHYSEELVCEAGLGDGHPAVRIGQLLNALVRNVRFVCAIGLHTGGLQVADCERMFREKAFQDPGNARQQAARGTFDPAYLNYTLGKLMLLKLREDWMARRGRGASLRTFHDRLLSYGGPPIPLVRAAMLGDDAGSPL